MRKTYLLTLFLAICFLGAGHLRAAPNINCHDMSVLVGATANTVPRPSITVFWQKHPYAVNYIVRRKFLSQNANSDWKLIAYNLDSLTTSYTDTTAKMGVEYDYEVIATAYAVWGLEHYPTDALKFFAYGYISAAIEAPEKENPGDVLLVVDSSLYDSIEPSVNLLADQLKKEGWRVLPYLKASRAEEFDKYKVSNVKNEIISITNDKSYKLNSIILIGRVPVPYSGNLNPDAHPDHLGAWPADGFYGIMSMKDWTDKLVKDTVASDRNNWNIPGDGKFDVSDFSVTPVKIPIGRIDFYNLPAFGKSESQLINEYIEKNLSYRTGATKYITRGVIDDNFGAFGGGEGFATSGWRNFAALCGPDSVREADFFETLGTENYLWSYGCGGGTSHSAGGVGTTEDLAVKPVNGIFTFLFGSYFGDWNQQNNFLRGSIASQPSAITCAWAGRPQWYMHHMGLGYPIGESEIISQNNYDCYNNNTVWVNSTQSTTIVWGRQGVHVTLIGDPTLRMFAGCTPTPTTLTINKIGDGINRLEWTQEGDGDALCYNVYSSPSPDGPYVKVNKTRIKGLTYVDTTVIEGRVYYAVAASNLITNNSGTIWNSGARIFGEAEGKGIADEPARAELALGPNPASERVEFKLLTNEGGSLEIDILDLTGAKVMSFSRNFVDGGAATINWDLSDYSGAKLPQGIYLVSYKIGSKRGLAKLAVVK